MNVFIACDSFKGSMTSLEANAAVQAGLLDADPTIHTTLLPMADGGEGTVDALLYTLGGERVTVAVRGPLGGKVEASYGWIPETKTAIIETAAASGITLVGNDELDPWKATSFGTGELMAHALAHGARQMVIGLGGSATVDGGIGLLEALGVTFYDTEKQPISGNGKGLGRIDSIDLSSLRERFRDVEVTMASDVTNPLLGDTGAVHVFGPQKGAKTEDLATLEEGMASYAKVCAKAIGRDDANTAGAGAAGGIGFALQSFLSAKAMSGFSYIAEAAKLADILPSADLIITGEGQMDAQSFFGKVPVALANEAKPFNVPVIAFAGSVKGNAQQFASAGLQAVIPITNGPTSLSEAMTDGKKLLQESAERTWRLTQLFPHKHS
ncbi:glycerate kinase [Aureibacillus halotolerans]|uniref:Glycerate kinase n=1 Tax=Aureibacillus halotolerans TaxID=1508390 RepID=A0A4R6TQF2_9BACI|nr:glycerate kinase [Aureibacillus halotolerans]TDQ34132.1 glycerate kinase [Aureibacillus halotolerans]